MESWKADEQMVGMETLNPQRRMGKTKNNPIQTQKSSKAHELP